MKALGANITNITMFQWKTRASANESETIVHRIIVTSNTLSKIQILCSIQGRIATKESGATVTFNSKSTVGQALFGTLMDLIRFHFVVWCGNFGFGPFPIGCPDLQTIPELSPYERRRNFPNGWKSQYPSHAMILQQSVRCASHSPSLNSREPSVTIFTHSG